MKTTWWVTGVVVALGSVGCSASLQSLSAGHIGCRPSEIQISEHDTEGDATGGNSETWVASCRGRDHICTRARGFGQSVSSQTGCSELGTENEAPRAASKSTSAASSATSSPASSGDIDPESGSQAATAASDSEAPTGVAGFKLGHKRKRTQKACESAGHSWKKLKKSRYLCGGAAEKFALKGSFAIQFCSRRVCGITLVHTPADSWHEGLKALHAALGKKYGPQATEDVHLEFTCQRDERFSQCLAHGAAHATYEWQWPSGAEVTLFAEKPTPALDGAVAPSLRLRYKAAPIEKKPAEPSVLEMSL